MFSYADTQRYRIGVNAMQLPVNRPLKVNSHGQQGFMNGNITKGEVNYQPNGFNGNPDRSEGIYSQEDGYKQSSLPLSGATQQQMIKKTLNFRQAGETYRSFSEKDRTALINNFAGDLLAVKSMKIRNQIVAHTYAADTEYGERLAKAAKADLSEVKRIASGLNDDTKKVAGQ